MRISGITIKDEAQIQYGLTAIYGIGLSRSQSILKKLDIGFEVKTKDLTPEQEQTIREAVGEFTLEGDLKRLQSMNIKHLKDVGSYRGTRHSRRLPTRGQRTKTNARTWKGKVKTAGTGRRKVSKT